MVFNIPFIPDVATNSFITELPVSIEVEVEHTDISARKVENSPFPPTIFTISGCITTIATHAITTDKKRVTSAGNFFAISTIVTAGTSRSHADMLKLFFSTSDNSAICTDASNLWVRLTTKKTISAKINDGMVVIDIYLICSKSGTRAVEDANTVVSDKADTLSPKYAPEMIAPATHPSEYPCASPTPIRATPIVAIVVQELPVTIATTAQIKHATARNTLGWIICKP